ncbi:44960_t:CDS:2, partial [Gigaspora margarita]
THYSFENNINLTGSAKSNELNSETRMSPEALYENTSSDSLNFNLNPSQLLNINLSESSRAN